jgi:hypothetical protein
MTEARVDADALTRSRRRGGEAAAGYEDFFGPITTRLAEPLLDAAGVGPGDRVPMPPSRLCRC